MWPFLWPFVWSLNRRFMASDRGNRTLHAAHSQLLLCHALALQALCGQPHDLHALRQAHTKLLGSMP